MLLRQLHQEDVPALIDLARNDVLLNAFVLGHLRSRVLPGAAIYGSFAGEELVAACWAGANIVPVNMDPALAPLFAYAIHAHAAQYASVFGAQDAVLALFAELEPLGHAAREIRATQPFMIHDAEPASGADEVRPALSSDYQYVLPAAVAMFEEEVGFSPFTAGEEAYRQRVRRLIGAGHTLIHTAPDGTVVFKADLGIVTEDTCQIQGVWVHPRWRGQGRAAAWMSEVVAYSRRFAPVASLYVNSFNAPARAVYEKSGFTEYARFATVLF